MPVGPWGSLVVLKEHSKQGIADRSQADVEQEEEAESSYRNGWRVSHGHGVFWLSTRWSSMAAGRYGRKAFDWYQTWMQL